MCFVVGESTIKLSTLRICQRGGVGNAVPELFDKHQALLDAEPFDTK